MAVIETLEVIGIIAQFIGIVFMLCTLVYSLVRSRFGRDREFLRENANFYSIPFRPAALEDAGPTGEQKALFARAMMNLSADYQRFLAGDLGESQWRETRLIIHDVYIDRRVFRRWWVDEGRAQFGSEWRALIDELIEAHEAADSD